MNLFLFQCCVIQSETGYILDIPLHTLKHNNVGITFNFGYIVVYNWAIIGISWINLNCVFSVSYWQKKSEFITHLPQTLIQSIHYAAWHLHSCWLESHSFNADDIVDHLDCFCSSPTGFSGITFQHDADIFMEVWRVRAKKGFTKYPILNECASMAQPRRKLLVIDEQITSRGNNSHAIRCVYCQREALQSISSMRLISPICMFSNHTVHPVIST